MGAQHAGGLFQYLVAGCVAERVVNVLETIEIDMQQGEVSGVLACAVQGKLLVEEAPVGKPGEGIVQGIVLQHEPGVFQRPVLRLGRQLGLKQFGLQADVVRHVPVRADDALCA